MTTTTSIAAACLAVLTLALAGPAIAQSGPPGDAAAGVSRHAMQFVRIYDTDGNGTVSMAEIEAEQKRILGAADVDGSGALSVEEFRRRGRLIQSLGTTTLFDMLDTNADRAITADELAAPSARWFGRYDANGDGAMSAEELPQRLPPRAWRQARPAPLTKQCRRCARSCGKATRGRTKTPWCSRWRVARTLR